MTQRESLSLLKEYPEMMTVEEFYRKGHEIGMKLAQMFEEAE